MTETMTDIDRILAGKKATDEFLEWLKRNLFYIFEHKGQITKDVSSRSSRTYREIEVPDIHSRRKKFGTLCIEIELVPHPEIDGRVEFELKIQGRQAFWAFSPKEFRYDAVLIATYFTFLRKPLGDFFDKVFILSRSDRVYMQAPGKNHYLWPGDECPDELLPE